MRPARTFRARPSGIHHQRGVGLIEILVAVLILALGLLGMAGLQANALKTNQSSYARGQAVMLSYYMLDAMRADRASALSLTYNTGAVSAGGGPGRGGLRRRGRRAHAPTPAKRSDRLLSTVERAAPIAMCMSRYW